MSCWEKGQLYWYNEPSQTHCQSQTWHVSGMTWDKSNKHLHRPQATMLATKCTMSSAAAKAIFTDEVPTTGVPTNHMVRHNKTTLTHSLPRSAIYVASQLAGNMRMLCKSTQHCDNRIALSPQGCSEHQPAASTHTSTPPTHPSTQLALKLAVLDGLSSVEAHFHPRHTHLQGHATQCLCCSPQMVSVHHSAHQGLQTNNSSNDHADRHALA